MHKLLNSHKKFLFRTTNGLQQSPAVMNLHLEKRMCMNNIIKFHTAKSLFVG